MFKQLIKFTTNFKEFASLIFSFEILMYMIIGYFIGCDTISFLIIWEMILLSIILTIFQYIFYISDLFAKFPKGITVFLHYLASLVVVLLTSKIFAWYNLNTIKSLAIAILIFTLAFICMVFSIELYNKSTGEIYNEKLQIYKNSKAQKRR